MGAGLKTGNYNSPRLEHTNLPFSLAGSEALLEGSPAPPTPPPPHQLRPLLWLPPAEMTLVEQSDFSTALGALATNCWPRGESWLEAGLWGCDLNGWQAEGHYPGRC